MSVSQNIYMYVGDTQSLDTQIICFVFLQIEGVSDKSYICPNVTIFSRNLLYTWKMNAIKTALVKKKHLMLLIT